MNQQTRKRLIWADVIMLIALVSSLLIQAPMWVTELLTIATLGVVANSLRLRIRQRGSK